LSFESSDSSEDEERVLLRGEDEDEEEEEEEGEGEGEGERGEGEEMLVTEEEGVVLRGVEGAVDGPPKVEVVESDRCKNVVM
jgi:hypothetical protein